MAKTKSTNPFPDYVRISPPNKEKLAELTLRAKGESRSLTEFANTCGVSASTLSRVINQKTTRPNSDDLIAAIAENADPDSGVTLQDLLEAHGLALVTLNREPMVDGSIRHGKTYTPTQIILKVAEDASQYISSTSASSQLITNAAKIIKESAIERSAREIIQNELLLRGYQVSITMNTNVISTPSLRYMADFVVETNALEDCGVSQWAFDIQNGAHRPILHKLSWMFGAAYIDSTIHRGIKLSLVTSDKGEFDEVKSRFSEIKIKDCISVVLVDTLKRCVVDEFQIPMIGRKKPKYVFKQEYT